MRIYSVGDYGYVRNSVLGCVLFLSDCFLPQYLEHLLRKLRKHSAQTLSYSKKNQKSCSEGQERKKNALTYLVFTPADMVWLAAVVPLWPWSHRLICGAVIGLAKGM